MAKAPTKKMKAPAVMLVVMKKESNGKGKGKKMRGGCEDADMEEYRKGGMVRKPKKKGCK
jgi:hypothetical protein